MFFKLDLVLLCLFVVVKIVNCNEPLPSFLKVCQRSDPQIDDCILSSVEELRPRFGDGIPELFIPPLEPLLVPEVKIDQSSGPIFIHSKYENIFIYGLSNFIIHEVRTDIDNDKFMLKLEFPNLNISAMYTIDGKLMMMPLKGQGNLNGNFSNLIVNVFLKGERYMKLNDIEEIEHIKIKDIIVRYTIGGSSVNLDNLFNGEPTLGATMNTFLNENWKTVASEVKPVMQDTISKMVKAVTDTFFYMFSLSQLFPK